MVTYVLRAQLVSCCSKLQAVWPEMAIYLTLGNFLKPSATINLPKSPTFLGNLVKVLKYIIFLVNSFLGNWMHLLFDAVSRRNFCRRCRILFKDSQIRWYFVPTKVSPSIDTKFMLAYQTDDKVSTHNQNYTYYPFAPFVSCKRVERQRYLDAVFVLFTGLLR